MKKSFFWAVLLIGLFSCERNDRFESHALFLLLEGTVTNTQGEPLEGATVESLRRDWDGAGNQQVWVEAQVKTDSTGYFRFTESVSRIRISKYGFFDYNNDEVSSYMSSGPVDAVLHQACYLNFELKNPLQHDQICVIIQNIEQQCNDFYVQECFYDVNSARTSCVVKGGKMADLKFRYQDSTGIPAGLVDTLLFCAEGDTINFTQVLDF